MMRCLGLDRTFLWALRSISRLFVRPSVMPEDAVARLQGRTRPVLYVLDERSLSDFLALQQVCMDAGLRRPGKLATGPLTLRLSYVAVERRAGVLRKRPDHRMPRELQSALEAAAHHPELELDVVPVAVFWGRAPQRERSWLDLVLSESWALVGPFRRLMSILFNGRATLIRFGEPRPVRSWLAEGHDPARSARRLLKDLRAEFRHMRVDSVGPELATRRVMVAQVLRTRAVRQAVRQDMRERNVTRRETLRQARRFALEIAADYSHAFVRFMDRLLAWLWTRLYDGVDVRNAKHLDRLPEGCEIVYVPCHRSHMDYLLLSYVIYYRGYAVPHVAAGINLNLPVIGRFLRMGGSVDYDNSIVGQLTAELLDFNCVTVCVKLEISGEKITAEREIEGGREIVETSLPAVITCQKGLNEPRYASLKGIMAAKKKTIEEKSAASYISTSEVIGMHLPAGKQPGRIVGSDASAVPELVRLLKEEAKVI